jgi:hypothetical protein
MTMTGLTLAPFVAALTLSGLLSGPLAAENPSPEQIGDDTAFLGVLPKFAVPDDVQPIPGAVNEPFLTCEAVWPQGYTLSQSGPEARAYRDIYSFVRARNVIAKGNCSCDGKVADWDDVSPIAAAIRAHYRTERLRWQHTAEVSDQARTLVAIAETLCGGPF